MMEIVEKRLSELKHPEQNVRMHSQKQIKEYCRSISKYGQTKPMVIDENGVILIGNGLYDALLAMGRESGSCMVKAGLTEKEKKKLMLADNRIYSLGVDNMSVFDEIIAELDGDFDIPGYDDELLNSLIADDGNVDEMLAGYGIVSDEDRAGMERAGERYRENEAAFEQGAEEVRPVPQNAPVPQDGQGDASPSGFSAGAEVTPASAENVQDAPAERLQRRFIICPRCGERIWL